VNQSVWMELKEPSPLSLRIKTGDDFRTKGRIINGGKGYFKFQNSEEIWIKNGADSPENFLAFADFDQTSRFSLKTEVREGEADPKKDLHKYEPHLADWNEETLWRTYTMLTDLESVFRSLKSELGLRPIYHRKEERVNGHILSLSLPIISSRLFVINSRLNILMIAGKRFDEEWKISNALPLFYGVKMGEPFT